MIRGLVEEIRKGLKPGMVKIKTFLERTIASIQYKAKSNEEYQALLKAWNIICEEIIEKERYFFAWLIR